MFFLHIPIIASLTLMCFFSGCKGRKERVERETVYINQESALFKTPEPVAQTPPLYPWENRFVGSHFRISKDFFRCKGSSENPAQHLKKNGRIIHSYNDCDGKHSLPLKEGKEFVYPCLIALLNYIQQKCGQEVIITTGHSCVAHSGYADPSPYNYSSKHMIGAEVDFYVENVGPEEIIALIQQYYLDHPEYGSQKEFTEFTRYERGNLNVVTPPWQNKEIFVKHYLPDEGRDFDNQHELPYLSIQVRYDVEREERVLFKREVAENFLYDN